MQVADIAVIGAGVAGASLAWAIAPQRRVLVLEREAQPGYHASGRSAAQFSETYGNAVVRALSSGSRDFYFRPPRDFDGYALTGPRGTMMVGLDEDPAMLDRLAEEVSALSPGVRRLTPDEVLARVPILRPERVTGAVIEPEARDIDTNVVLQGFLRGLRREGGDVLTDAEVTGLSRTAGGWRVETRAGTVEAGIVVNAAGAWADRIAALAGAHAVGLTPKRRTACLIDAQGHAVDDWPLVVDTRETFYFKPDAGKLLLSPADETPTEPCDAQPEELDVAIAADRLERATTLAVRRVSHRWAGLRTFAADKTPVVGFDDDLPGFFWLAGQGGYGFQTAPAMARLAAALLLGDAVPDDLQGLGITADALAPGRFTRNGTAAGIGAS
jgi:D-arginine dehydrogenase